MKKADEDNQKRHEKATRGMKEKDIKELLALSSEMEENAKEIIENAQAIQKIVKNCKPKDVVK